MSRHPATAGFSLVELLLVLGIASVVMAFALPSFARWIADAELRAGSSALSVALASARLRAIETRRPVSVCPLASGRSCAQGIDWSGGWMVFDDPRQAGEPTGADAIREVARMDAGALIRSTIGRTRLTFRPDGSSAGSNVTLTLCHPDHHGLGRQIIVSNVGRARVGPLPPGFACRRR